MSLQIRHKYDKDVQKCLTYVLSKAQLGDWFVLYQLSKNYNPYFYREFIKELAIELKQRPKKSKALSSKTSLGKKVYLSCIKSIVNIFQRTVL